MGYVCGKAHCTRLAFEKKFGCRIRILDEVTIGIHGSAEDVSRCFAELHKLQRQARVRTTPEAAEAAAPAPFPPSFLANEDAAIRVLGNSVPPSVDADTHPPNRQYVAGFGYVGPVRT